MASNSFGDIFRITSFGESHGPAVGVVIDGCPPGVSWDEGLLQENLKRRRPGQSAFVSERKEEDTVELLSGVYQGKTLGTPIALVVKNQNQDSSAYDKIQTQARSGHADLVWKDKYKHWDPRGGGRASGRETVARVLGGSVAQMFLRSQVPELVVLGYSKKIGNKTLSQNDLKRLRTESSLAGLRSQIEESPIRFLGDHAREVESYLSEIKKSGSSVGGIAELRICGAPRGLGEPVFDKVKNQLASALMSVGATQGVLFGPLDFDSDKEGLDFHQGEHHRTHYGGLNGGMTTGEDILIQVLFKPTSSILDVAKQGRHDPCVMIRAIPVLEAMIHIALADAYLKAGAYSPQSSWQIPVS